ncbi:hypothetical protein PAMP_020039 [Pampus punctatissimus]
MLTRVKSAVANFMGGMMAGGSNSDHPGGSELPLRFPYSRPEFLGLSPDEIECSADHVARPILILKETKRLPWSTGYAEVINAGKSTLNEDQACCEVLMVKRRPAGSPVSNRTPTTRRRSSLPNGEGLGFRENPDNSEDLIFHYWALFDGHAGSGAAVVASRLLHHHIALHLQEVMEILCTPNLLAPTCLGEEPINHHLTPTSQRALTRAASLRGAAGAPGSPNTPPTRFFTEKKVSQESLVIGAIENAFKDMILPGGEKGVDVYADIFIIKDFACSMRAIVIRAGEVIPVSTEFTPESERQRLQFLVGKNLSQLLFSEHSCQILAELTSPPVETQAMLSFVSLTLPALFASVIDYGIVFPIPWVGQKVYLNPTVNCANLSDSSGADTGPTQCHLKVCRRVAYKTIEDDDLKFPLIYGEGKKARVLATIGVTRGLGDHNLKVHDSNIYIKPFLSCCPEVRVYPLAQCEHGADDVLVLGTDGLWDVLSNQEVAEAVTCFLANCDPDDQHRYTMAAQDLVMRARGMLKDRGWRISNDRLGSGDDISVYIIPLMYGNKQN